ncbi:MAG: MATE family efflux transporter [Candidatus Omnitrophica bacterium]|nr:MATE family efflux transporter [Candidatus Omnitrophota bacterium]
MGKYKIQKKDMPHVVAGGMREMINLAMPIVVSQACYTIMIFTDRLFLSRVGPNMMNATLGGGLSAFMMITFFLGLTSYSTALVAQYLGSGQKNICATVVNQAVIIAVVAAPIIILCKPFALFLFDKTGIDNEQLIYQKIYFNILINGSVIVLVRNCFSSFFSGIGRTKTVMIAAATAMSVNICLNYVLIFGKFGVPALGIRGAAYGTVIGSMSALLVFIVSYFSKKNRIEYSMKKAKLFVWPIMKKLLKFGYPPGIEMFLNLLAFNCIVLIFHSKGLATATASTIVFNWDLVAFLPLIGLEIAVTSLVGRYMGAGRPEIAERSVSSGLKLGILYSIIILIFFVFFPGLLINVFRPNGSQEAFMLAAPLAVFMVRMASLYVLVEAMIFIYVGALRGAGDTFWAMCYSVALHWILVPIIFVMMKVYGTTAETGWTTLVIIFMISSVVVYMRYKEGKWKQLKVIQEPPTTIPPNAGQVAEDF